MCALFIVGWLFVGLLGIMLLNIMLWMFSRKITDFTVVDLFDAIFLGVLSGPIVYAVIILFLIDFFIDIVVRKLGFLTIGLQNKVLIKRKK